MINVSICPHDTLKGVEKWERFTLELGKTLKEQINFIKIDDFDKENSLIESEVLDLYYANPYASVKLYEKGYQPIARLKDYKDKYILLGHQPLENILSNPNMFKVAVLEKALYSLIQFIDKYHIDYKYLIIQKKKSWEEVLEAFLSKQVDYAIVYEEFIDDTNIEYKLDEFIYDISHVFMVKKEKEQIISSALLSLPDIEPVSFYYIENIKNILKFFENKLLLLKYKQFFDLLIKADNIGVIIYKDKIIYMNDFMLKKLGYSLEEIRHCSIIDLIYESNKNIILNNMQSRLKGKFFSYSYEKLKLIKKDGSILYIQAISSTINHEDAPAGFVLCIDITEEVNSKKLVDLQRSINQAIIETNTEEELFKKICDSLVKNVGIKYAVVMIEDDEKFLIPIYETGESQEYLNYVKISTDPSKDIGNGPLGIAFRENRIVINQNTYTSDLVKPFKKELLKRNFFSTCSIPIMLGDRVKYAIGLYADEIGFFNQEMVLTLDEIKKDVEFAIFKIDSVKKLKIFMEVIQKGRNWIIVVDEGGYIQLVSNEVIKSLQFNKDLLNTHIDNIFDKENINWATLKNILQKENFIEKTIQIKDRFDNLFYIELNISKVELDDKHILYLIMGRDITAETELLFEIEKIKYMDDSTGFFNFLGFSSISNNNLLDIFQENLLTRKYGALIAIVDFSNQANLSKFESEEQLINTIKNIFENTLHNIREFNIDEIIIGRISSLQFGIFAKLKDNTEEISKTAFNIIDLVRHEIENYYLIYNIGANVVYEYENFFDIFKKLNTALSFAKQEGENTTQFYSINIQELEKKYSVAEQLLEKAIREHLFVFHYQPYVDIHTREIKGAEALVRIQEGQTLHFPGIFIDYLESSRFLRAFEDIMLDVIKENIIDFHKIKSIPISINISAKSFKNNKFLSKLLNFCQETGVYIEITERLVLEDPERTMQFIQTLKANTNSKIEIDDFGTGYSSLSYLKKIDADILKIDISFINSMVHDAKDATLVKNIINLARDLGMKTIAEGVETEEQLNMLRYMNCDYAQGFLFSKALPKEEFIKVLKIGYL